MSNVEVTLKTGSAMSLVDVTEAAVNQVIAGFFAVESVPVTGLAAAAVTQPTQPVVTKQPVKTIVSSPVAPPSPSVVATTPKAKAAPKENVQLKEEAVAPSESNEGVPKVMPLIGHERTLVTPIKEVAKITKDDVDEGVRYLEDGTPIYKAEFWCPTCGEHGNRFIRDGNFFLKCFSCQEKIEVEDAVPSEDALTANADGVYFVARHKWE